MLSALAILFASAFTLTSSAHETKRKIIVFKDGVSSTQKDATIRKHGGETIKELGIIHGVAAVLPNGATLADDSSVLRVDDDIVVSALGKPSSTQPAQMIPWGVDHIDAELVWPTGNQADPIKVGIIDTGISNKHPDLLSNIKGGINTINPQKSWNDDNGHGSHVAGIVATINNTVGVVGVAPLTDLYAIKALGANGSGYLSDIIEGLEWSMANGIQVVNMSLGTSSNIQSFHDAITIAQNAGIVLVGAAGNSGGAVNYPAAYPEVIAVSATDQNNTIASWSSRGVEVDIAAPGVSIYSTYKGTEYATLSGTSMASPHVAGTAALILNTTVGANDTNQNGKWDPVEVQQKLQASATDLGSVGSDDLYGFGLVNAYQAVQ